MLNFYDIISSMIYYSTHNYLKDKVHKKHLINSVSTIHALLSFLFCFLYLQSEKNKILLFLLITNSKGYYLYDGIDQYILLNNKFSLTNVAYIYHHLASVYTFSVSSEIYNWVYLLYLAEMANIPTKCVYYLIKEQQIKKEKYLLTTFIKIVQILLYIYVRVYIFTIEFYNLLSNYNLLVENEIEKVVIANIPLYLLGIFWTYSVFDSIKKDNIFKLKNNKDK